MCTLCLSDIGELRDEWLREPRRTDSATLGNATATVAAAIPTPSRIDVAVIEKEAA